MNTDNLGKKGKDIITGFEGIITGCVSYVTGCDQYLLAPKCKETNEKPASSWFDENRIEILEDKKIELETSDREGACEAAPIK